MCNVYLKESVRAKKKKYMCQFPILIFNEKTCWVLKRNVLVKMVSVCCLATAIRAVLLFSYVSPQWIMGVGKYN